MAPPALPADEQAPLAEVPLGLTGAGAGMGAGVGCGVQGLGALEGEARPPVRTWVWRQSDPVDVQPCGRGSPVPGHAVPSSHTVASVADVGSQRIPPAVPVTGTVTGAMVVEERGSPPEAAPVTVGPLVPVPSRVGGAAGGGATTVVTC